MGDQMMTCTHRMKMFRSIAFVIAYLLGSGLGQEITTEAEINDEGLDIATKPLEIGTHNGMKDIEVTIEPFLTEKHIDDFSVVVVRNGQKPSFKRNRATCSDGSRPKCPDDLCPSGGISSDTNIVENKKKCKCPRRRKICENGDKPNFQKNQPRCTDGSKPRCPAKRCSNLDQFLVEISPVMQETTTETSIFHTVSDFPTEKHVDPPVTRNPNDEMFPLLELVTETPQCLQDGVVSCNGVRLDTDLIPSLKEGSVVMMLPGKDFAMEVQRFALSKTRNTSYHFLLSTGGSATMTVGENEDPEKEPSVYATIRTHGKWIYFVDSCGEDCTVILTRDSNYFNQFED